MLRIKPRVYGQEQLSFCCIFLLRPRVVSRKANNNQPAHIIALKGAKNMEGR